MVPLSLSVFSSARRSRNTATLISSSWLSTEVPDVRVARSHGMMVITARSKAISKLRAINKPAVENMVIFCPRGLWCYERHYRCYWHAIADDHVQLVRWQSTPRRYYLPTLYSDLSLPAGGDGFAKATLSIIRSVAMAEKSIKSMSMDVQAACI